MSTSTALPPPDLPPATRCPACDYEGNSQLMVGRHSRPFTHHCDEGPIAGKCGWVRCPECHCVWSMRTRAWKMMTKKPPTEPRGMDERGTP